MRLTRRAPQTEGRTITITFLTTIWLFFSSQIWPDDGSSSSPLHSPHVGGQLPSCRTGLPSSEAKGPAAQETKQKKVRFFFSRFKSFGQRVADAALWPAAHHSGSGRASIDSSVESSVEVVLESVEVSGSSRGLLLLEVRREARPPSAAGLPLPLSSGTAMGPTAAVIPKGFVGEEQSTSSIFGELGDGWAEGRCEGTANQSTERNSAGSTRRRVISYVPSGISCTAGAPQVDDPHDDGVDRGESTRASFSAVVPGGCG